MQRMNIDYRIAKRAGCAANLVEHTLLVKRVLSSVANGGTGPKEMINALNFR
jgi:hypothetical protein